VEAPIVMLAEDVAAILAIIVGYQRENLQESLARFREIAEQLNEPARSIMLRQAAQIYGVREL
jgi:hypothetical protein